MNGKRHLRQAIDSLYAGGVANHESYTRLVLDCLRANDANQAKRVQTHMEDTLFEPPDTFLDNRLLHLYAKTRKLSYARVLFDKMLKRDVFSWNMLLSANAKSGSYEDLKQVFDEMPVRDSVSYNTVISGFAGNGYLEESLQVFVRMQREGFRATEYTYVSALQACSQLQCLNHGKQIHGKILVDHSGGNSFVWNALTDMYAKCGEIDKARWLFDRMVDRTVVSWNLMISGYLKNKQPVKSIELFHEMQSSGSKIKIDDVTVSNVLGAYIQSGHLDEAVNLFRTINEKDDICWTTMIVGLVQNGKEEDALMLFSEMLSQGIMADCFTISSVVSSCAKLASLYNGQVMHGKSVRIGVDDNLLVSTSLVNMYCKCGVTKDAWVVFGMILVKNVASWNSMIGGLAQNGQDEEALSLYEEMLRENLKPDGFTFASVLTACNHSGLVDKGKACFDSMSELYGLTPSLDHYACMISLLGNSGNSGNIDKAMDLIKTMPHEPNARIWSSLLSVCAKKGDIVCGEMAARHLFEMDPLNAGPYIMLSNMYAGCGRWDDVASVRSLMKVKNAKKFAAYSWIDVDGKVFKFVSEDRTHVETEMIYEELGGLIKKVKEAGFVHDTNLVLHNVVEEEKVESICFHSEKLALAFGLIKKRGVLTPIRIMKNIRVCGDCHAFMKFVSNVIGRDIVLRDSNRFHHFVGGNCSCKDYW